MCFLVHRNLNHNRFFNLKNFFPKIPTDIQHTSVLTNILTFFRFSALSNPRSSPTIKTCFQAINFLTKAEDLMS